MIQNYQEVTSFPKPTLEVRCAIYSPNGQYFAYTQPKHVTLVLTKDEASNDEVVATIEVQDTFDLHFSPNGRYLAMWTKPILLNKESGVWSDNIIIYDVEKKEVATQWSNKHQGGWKPQFTQDGKFMAKNFNNKEIHFYDTTTNMDIKKPSYKFRLQDSSATFQNFQLSPGLNPAVAVFIPEKSGKPAQVLIYNIPSFNQPICTKSFFKAEKCQLKWNALGTALLALASTDHDTSNKSYYGAKVLFMILRGHLRLGSLLSVMDTCHRKPPSSTLVEMPSTLCPLHQEIPFCTHHMAVSSWWPALVICKVQWMCTTARINSARFVRLRHLTHPFVNGHHVAALS